MSEGENIISFNFRAANTPESPQPEKRATSEEEMQRLIEMLNGRNYTEKMDKFIATMKKLKDMRAYLSGLQAFATHETKALRHDLIKGMSFDQMSDAVLNSNDKKWQTNPAYYEAISAYFTKENLSIKEEPQAGTVGFTVVE